MPRAIAYVAWKKARVARGEIAELRDNVAKLVKALVEDVVKGIDVYTTMRKGDDAAFRWALQNFYQAISRATIEDSKLNVSVWVPELGMWINESVDLGKELFEKLIQTLPVKLVAISSDGLAAIIAHDKYWDPNGYRAVYFSFEIEAAEGDIAEKLLVQAVEWVKKWEYKPITELLKGLRVPKTVIKKLEEVRARVKGRELLSKSMLVPEEGWAKLRVRVPGKGRLHAIVVRYGVPKINLTVFRGGIIEKFEKGKDIDVATIQIENGVVELGLRADPASVLSSVYVEFRYEAVSETMTTTITTTTTTTTTTTRTTTATTTATTTSSTQTTTSISSVITKTRAITETSTRTVAETLTSTATRTMTTTVVKEVTKSVTKTVPSYVSTTVEKTKTVATEISRFLDFAILGIGLAIGLAIALALVAMRRK